MNKDRRNRLKQIQKELTAAITATNISWEAFADNIDEIKDEEQEVFDDLPDSLQEGDKGSAMQNAIAHMEDATMKLEELIDPGTEDVNTEEIVKEVNLSLQAAME